VLEGLILAGLLLRATRGFIYVRHEYEEQIEALRREIEWARDRGFCGENLLGTNRSFPVEVFVSPGGYICGEQTALVEAIEDRRAEPRNRPPELQTNGLWNMPTLLNNVETIAWVPSIMIRDGAWYASHGASGSYRGARFFSVSGDVSRPGVYEVPIGIRLGTLIDEYCGGVRRGERLKAVALSGPSGGFLPARLPRAALPSHVAATLPAGDSEFDIRNLELDLPSFRKWNMMLGAGIVVYGESADMLRQTVACQEFFRDESCGKCVPCRIGSRRLAEIGAALEAGELAAEDLRAIGTPGGAISELAQTMRQTAICGLGTVAANPLTSFLTHFPSETRRPQQH
jgi:NADH:ubiquinone oxidoreductase subunit F (NADH-binding)